VPTETSTRRVSWNVTFSIVPPKIKAFGTKMRRLSDVSKLVVKRPISMTLPVTPAALITSPTLNGRKTSNITPDAMFESVPWNARPMAKAAAPMTAAKLVVWIPNIPSAASTAMIRRAQRAALLRKMPSVSSTLALAKPRRTTRRTQPATIQETTRKASAPAALMEKLTRALARATVSRLPISSSSMSMFRSAR